jgi:hypothetical protein
MEMFACSDCGRSFVTAWPRELLAALTGRCRCGGAFVSYGTVPMPDEPQTKPDPAGMRR